MKEKTYPYRFKTIEEFMKDLGQNSWRNPVNNCGFVMSMDYLLGKDYPFDIDIDKYSDDDYLPDIKCSTLLIGRGSWRVKKFMLTKNIIIEPNYKSRKIERVL